MRQNTSLELLESRRLLSAAIPFASLEEGTAIVRGNVFRDVNRNGVRESTEPAQANIRVYLDYNNNGTRDGDAEPISITNSLGGFRFETARAPETIAIRLLLTDTGLTQTRPANNAARVVTTVVGGNHEVESFGVAETIVTPPTPPPAVTILTGIVYTDRDRDGTRDVGEPGRPNVKVYLDTNENGTREDGEPITITNGEGRYFFERITAGNKVIRLALAGSGLQQTQPANGQPVRKTVVANTRNEADAFGVAEIIVTPPPVTTAIIRGNVFYDTNNNATRDSTEAGRANVRVYLDLDNDSVRDAVEPTVLTNSLGQYVFEKAPASPELRIRLDLTGTPLRQTLPTNNAPRTLTTVAGQTYVDQNFGVREVEVTPPPVTTAIIRGNVFYDANNNATRDSTESGRANVRVYLDLDNDSVRDATEPTVLTNSLGRYVFENAPARPELRIRLDLTGTPLRQTLPTNNAARVLATVAGQTYVDQNFGVREVVVTPPPVTTGTLRGRVYNDVNHNGMPDIGDAGVPNRSVYIDINHSGFRDAGDPQTLTNLEGRYTFTNVPPGTYNVRLYRGDLTQTSPPNNGSNVAVVTAGKIVGDLDFGTYRTPTTTAVALTSFAAVRKSDSILVNL